MSEPVQLPFAELENWAVLGASNMFLQLEISKRLLSLWEFELQGPEQVRESEQQLNHGNALSDATPGASREWRKRSENL